MHSTKTPFGSFFGCIGRLRRDTGGASAVEFAFIVPLMLTMLFGLVEITNGISADRKVTLTARALSDLVSQATTMTNSDFNDTFTAASGIMFPYDTSAIKSVVSEVKVDGGGNATVVWSKANANGVAKTTVSLPANLAVPNTYLIWSEVTYTYSPGVNWFITTAGLTMKEQLFTRPRQSNCVLYGTSTCP